MKKARRDAESEKVQSSPVSKSLLQRGFPTCFSLAFVPSFAEADREARLKLALFLREYSLSPTG